MDNKQNKILEIFYEQWKIFVSGIITSIVISYLLKNLTRILNSLQIFLKKQIPLWVGVCGVILIILIWILIHMISKKRSRISYFSFLPRPRYKIQDLGRCEILGVIWDCWIGSDTIVLLPGENVPSRVWVEGPFCPECNYELERKEKFWYCVLCKKKFKIPKDLKENTREKIIKIFEAELRKKESS